MDITIAHFSWDKAYSDLRLIIYFKTNEIILLCLLLFCSFLILSKVNLQ